MKNWNFSLWLGAAYLAIFHAWLHLPPAGILTLGMLASAGLLMAFRQASRNRYFANAWDRLFHLSVILDIALEAMIPLHDGYSFYLCAAAFALVIGFYRGAVLDRVGRVSHPGTVVEPLSPIG